MSDNKSTFFLYYITATLLLLLTSLQFNVAIASGCQNSVKVLQSRFNLTQQKIAQIQKLFESDPRYGLIEMSRYSEELKKFETIFSIPGQQFLFKSPSYEKLNTDIYIANQKAKKEKLKTFSLSNIVKWVKVARHLQPAPSKTHQLTDSLGQEFRRLREIKGPFEKKDSLRNSLHVETEKRIRILFSLYQRIRQDNDLLFEDDYLKIVQKVFEQIEDETGYHFRLTSREKIEATSFALDSHNLLKWDNSMGQIDQKIMKFAKKSENFSSFVSLLYRHIERKIYQMPVGITYRVKDLTAGLRFGEKSFLGGYLNYRNFKREDWLKNIEKRHGLIEAHFKMTNYQKKRLGITLDRAHRSEDFIFGKNEICDHHFHVCGTYANYMVVKHGVPIYSYGYLTPGHALISLALQKLAGSKQLQHLSFKHRTSGSIWNTAKIFSWHEFGAYAVLEFQIYGLIWSAGYFSYHELSNLFVQDNKTEEEIPVDKIISEKEFNEITSQYSRDLYE